MSTIATPQHLLHSLIAQQSAFGNIGAIYVHTTWSRLYTKKGKQK